ncbi:MAG: glycoside hydrolase [Bacteroidetes bacterium]|jgi:1,4-alpha-glucan branching enzyme|nr:MAG: glycoside hydrolase [Bacteroidota bacterium]
MAITKKELKSKPVSKVTFKVTKEVIGEATTVFLVGDFNGWDQTAEPLKADKKGTFSATLDLETGRDYQFRYLVDGVRWENDEAADKYAQSPFSDAQNSVVSL